MEIDDLAVSFDCKRGGIGFNCEREGQTDEYGVHIRWGQTHDLELFVTRGGTRSGDTFGPDDVRVAVSASGASLVEEYFEPQYSIQENFNNCGSRCAGLVVESIAVPAPPE